jgi:hypothetical protein
MYLLYYRVSRTFNNTLDCCQTNIWRRTVSYHYKIELCKTINHSSYKKNPNLLSLYICIHPWNFNFLNNVTIIKLMFSSFRHRRLYLILAIIIRPLVLLLRNGFKLFRTWAYLTMVIPEMFSKSFLFLHC